MSLLLGDNILTLDELNENFTFDIEEKLPTGKLGIRFEKNNNKCIVIEILPDSKLKDVIKKNDILHKLNDIYLGNLSTKCI